MNGVEICMTVNITKTVLVLIQKVLIRVGTALSVAVPFTAMLSLAVSRLGLSAIPMKGTTAKVSALFSSRSLVESSFLG